MTEIEIEKQKPEEFLIFSIRIMEDDSSFFFLIGGCLIDTIIDYFIHLKMNEAERLYGGN